MGYYHGGGIKKLDELDLAEQEVLRCRAAVEQNGRKRAFFTEYRDRPVVGYKRLIQLQRQIAQLMKQQEQEMAKLDMAAFMVETCEALDAGLVEKLSLAEKKVKDILEARRRERAASQPKPSASERKPRTPQLDQATKDNLARAGFDLGMLQKLASLV
jgi:hypothetical protein